VLGQWLRHQTIGLLYQDEAMEAYQRRDYNTVLDVITTAQNIDAAMAGKGETDPFAHPMTAEQLLMMEFTDEEFLVKDILTAEQFCVLGGPFKSMKTGLVVDLAVSLATGAPFLDTFAVPAPVKVVICSAETSAREMQGKVRRVLGARGMDVADLAERLVWIRGTPKLSKAAGINQVRGAIEKHRPPNGPCVFVIDPLYVSLLEQGSKKSSGDVFATGPILEAFAEVCRANKCTPITCHHFNRAGEKGAIPTLDDLSGAGCAEFARQWLLLKRVSPYEHNGIHKLWMVAGGSDARSLTKKLLINEGTKEKPLWSITLEDLAECRQREQQSRGMKLVGDLLNTIQALTKDGESNLTKTRLMTAAKMSGSTINQAINIALSEGFILEYPGTTSQGRATTCYKIPDGITPPQ
jgi:hypothetical protein